MKPLTNKQVTDLFGSFKYTSNRDGSIKIDPVWVRENIVTLHTPLIPSIRCHRKIERQLSQVIYRIHLEGLGKFIKTFDGCWVPRHMQWNPKRSLSRHAWAVALDFNAATNPMGTYSDELKPIANVFKEYGFIWGGEWSGASVDPMHIEIYEVDRST
jgi:hypothetical protein